MRKLVCGAAAVALAIGVMLAPGQAQAWWRGGGVFFGFPPVVIGPPVVVAPPPVYYAPPPVYAAPVYAPPPYSAPAGRSCYAGAYVCPLDRPTPVGAGCSCPTNVGRAYGDAR